MEEKWDSACEWCKENWLSIVSVFVTIVIVVGIVILSISTFGTAIPVIAVGVVGAIVGISGQLISDIISCAITGDRNDTRFNAVRNQLAIYLRSFKYFSRTSFVCT